MITTLIADDHTLLRDGLRRSFEDSGEVQVVAEVGTGAQLLKDLPRFRPQVLLLDLKLPDANGLGLIKKCKALCAHTRIIVLTMFNHTNYALQSIEQGADGFMLKGCPFSELLQAIKTVQKGKTYVCTEMASEVIGRFKQSPRGHSLDVLSPREFEVLTLLCSGLSLKEAGAKLGISEKTVGTFRARLMTKLNLSSKTEMLRMALDAGLIQ